MGHSWFMLANIAQCYVSFSCTETWICCTYDFTLFWLSRYLTSPSCQFPMWILCFCTTFLHWGSPIFPSPSTPSPLGRSSNHRQSNALWTLWDTVLTLACLPPLNSRLMCRDVTLCPKVDVYYMHFRWTPNVWSSPGPTVKMILSWVKIILDLSDPASCSHPDLLSFISRSNPHFKHDQCYCPHACSEALSLSPAAVSCWGCKQAS